jgi:hypothetical protein
LLRDLSWSSEHSPLALFLEPVVVVIEGGVRKDSSELRSKEL